jgi:hypothetical protein
MYFLDLGNDPFNKVNYPFFFLGCSILSSWMQDYKIPGTDIEVKVDDLVSIAGAGIQARNAVKAPVKFFYSKVLGRDVRNTSEYFFGFDKAIVSRD